MARPGGRWGLLGGFWELGGASGELRGRFLELLGAHFDALFALRCCLRRGLQGGFRRVVSRSDVSSFRRSGDNFGRPWS